MAQGQGVQPFDSFAMDMVVGMEHVRQRAIVVSLVDVVADHIHQNWYLFGSFVDLSTVKHMLLVGMVACHIQSAGGESESHCP
jgi:hypothetical protein